MKKKIGILDADISSQNIIIKQKNRDKRMKNNK